MYPIAYSRYSPTDTLPLLTKPQFIGNRFGLSAGRLVFGPFHVSFFAASKWGSVAFMWNLGPAGALVGQIHSWTNIFRSKIGGILNLIAGYFCVFFVSPYISRIHTASYNWWHLQGWDVRLAFPFEEDAKEKQFWNHLEFVRMLRKKRQGVWKVLEVAGFFGVRGVYSTHKCGEQWMIFKFHSKTEWWWWWWWW